MTSATKNDLLLNITGEIDKNPTDSQDFTSSALVKIHAETEGYASPPFSLAVFPKQILLYFEGNNVQSPIQKAHKSNRGLHGGQSNSPRKRWWQWEDVQAPRVRFWEGQ